jgi:RNA-directed DNA polymerase
MRGLFRNLGDPDDSARDGGTEARRKRSAKEGRREVGSLHCTEEAGELAREDPAEGRERRTAEPLEGTMEEAPTSQTVSTKLERIATRAREAPDTALRTLAHHIDVEWLKEAHRRTRKDGAAGVDGVTADDYARELEKNLRSLHERAKAGTYRAPPVRRVNIPKGDGRMRPIGIPTFEDKIMQRAVAMVLEAVYEQDFLDCSYGFRPGRSAHDALKALREATMKMGGGWVLEVDIQSFFDALDHAHLRDALSRRIGDGSLMRLIGKWLNAGVMEGMGIRHPKAGTPQGGVISPILANVYLHEVLDLWFEREVKPRLRGRATLVRYADDFVILLEREDDARRVQDVLPKRFGKYGLTLHPEKTRLVPFKRPKSKPTKGDGDGPPGSFDLLGFTHHWALSRNGHWIVLLKTAKSRFSRALRHIRDWCRRYRHVPVRVQWETLTRKVRGHFNYFGVAGNGRALWRFGNAVYRVWRSWLNRRSQRARVTWKKMRALHTRYPLPSSTEANLRSLRA